MPRKRCGSCRYYGKVIVVPGYKARGCGLRQTRLTPDQTACAEHKAKKKAT